MAWFSHNGNAEIWLAWKEQIIYPLLILKMKYFPKISRGDVYLSPANIEDVEQITKRLNNMYITDLFQVSHKIYWIEKWKNLIEYYNKSWDYFFAIVQNDWNKFIGLLWLSDIDFINQTCELSIMIWETKNHNKWYWADAINAALFYAFNTLNLYNIWLCVKEHNKNAIACYKKVWFQEIWTRHHCRYCSGERYDLKLMEMLRPDWQEKNK